ncbi:V-type proton ATPase subunit e 2-like [Ptychodera flava]|uniref:V-type proton ATPase subunit e 2-like n=1 Tax=Ptychodera flava TaxID=63121 RepID=UPI00396A925F
MVASATIVPVVVMTLFWLLVGAVAPFLVPKGPNRGIIQLMLALTAVCCYSFWACAFIMQLNPLIGPNLENTTILAIQWEWEDNYANTWVPS